MKKTYNQPAVTVTAIKAVTPLASSPIGGKVYGKNAESGQYGLSRQDNAWDAIWGDVEESEED